MKRVILLFLSICFISFNSDAQTNAADSAVSAFIPNFGYSFQLPGGDVAKTFGNNSTIGGGFFYKSKSNILLSLDMNYIFGNSVKDAKSILSMVITDQDHIIDGNGTYALFSLYERGYTLNFRFGKIFDFLSLTPNSGLMLMGGVRYMEHRLVIDNQFHTAPQISDDYAKGYDRLTGGININEFVGYFYMGKSRILNFYGGFEFFQGFTKSKRDYVFDLQKKDTENKLDLYFGFKVGWMIPIFNRAPDKYYYY